MSFDKEELLALIDEVDLVSCDGPGPIGWVYFIVCTDAPRCKIGFTKSAPEKRLKNLQTGSASELALIAVHPGTPDTERRLHEKFSASCIRGEWFEITNELRAYLVQTVWAMTEFSLRNGWKPTQWMLQGTASTLDSLGAISEGLAEALESVE